MDYQVPELTKEDLKSLLQPQLGEDLVVESFTSKPLTKPGENYGSTVLALEVNILQGTDKKISKKLSLVAKLAPPSEFIWNYFDSPNTFCKEITCLTSVKEEYDKLQHEKGVPKSTFLDVFPKCYGARTTLAQEIGNKADKNAAILLENLKALNYRVGEQRIGFDLQHSQMFVSRLARFHAISVALKILKPQVFKETVLKACKPHNSIFGEKELKENSLIMLNIAKTIHGCESYIDRLKAAFELDDQRQLDRTLFPPREPYASIYHADLWVNNMMFRYASDNDNTPLDLKFLDFQGVLYTSPVKDLLFFMYTSIEEGIRAQHHDSLIQLYYKNFTDCLKDLDCDISAFSFQSFLDEIEIFAPTEVARIFFMLLPICADKSEVPELDKVDLGSIFQQNNDVFKKKAKELLTDFVQRGWL